VSSDRPKGEPLLRQPDAQTCHDDRVDEQTQRRLADNEGLFRETNDAIERGQWPNEPGKLIRFRCECYRLTCGEAIQASLAEYEQVRKFPRRFLVADGHNLRDVEVVVDATNRFVVVEKTDAAGEVAAATDPRE
jgi:hypothetical protein